jgi:hypothetical protein
MRLNRRSSVAEFIRRLTNTSVKTALNYDKYSITPACFLFRRNQKQRRFRLRKLIYGYYAVQVAQNETNATSYRRCDRNTAYR